MNMQIVENMNRPSILALWRCGVVALWRCGVVALCIVPYSALASSEISFSYLRGDAEGYLQTPAGGQPGSTTRQRPTLKELGFDFLSIYDFSISRVVGDGKHKLLGGYQVIRAESTASLKRDLTSQNKNFSAGDVVKADLQADWLRFNWLYKWRTTEVAGKSFVVSLGAGLVFFDFHYQLDGGILKVDRAYSKLGYRAGTQLDWRLADKFTLQLDVFEGLPLPNTPVILSAGLKGKYTLWDKGSVGSLIAGVAYNRIDYEDEQTVPNHIRIETGPLFEAGLTINF